jgi:hypothetical protein
MAKVLLISRDDVVKFTTINGNVDTDKFIQYIAIAQDIDLMNYLGTELLEKLQQLIEDGDLVDHYENLVMRYCKPILIHYAMVQYLPFSAITISNKGVYKHSAENSEVVSKSEIEFLIQKEKSIADNYVKQMIKYLGLNLGLFPEYKFEYDQDVNPSRQTNIGGWYLNDNNETITGNECKGWYL